MNKIYLKKNIYILDVYLFIIYFNNKIQPQKNH